MTDIPMTTTMRPTPSAPTSDALMRRLRRTVAWRDLVPMHPRDGWRECLHPVPWLVAAWSAIAMGPWPLAIPAWFMFFLTALRLNHEAIHGNLGFGKTGHRRVLHVLSALMLGSNSAVAFNHLRHHRHLGEPDDLEGKAGRMTGLRVLAYGPLFPIEMHRAAWREGNADLRRRMLIDAAGNALLVTGAAVSPVLRAHLLAMLAAQCLTAFFAVWITHRGLAGHDLQARTERSALVNWMSYNMFLHLEHHAFPAVPVKRLATLAARLDAAAPAIAARARHVLPVLKQGG